MSIAQSSVLRPAFGGPETPSLASHGDRVRSLQAETLSVTRDHIAELAQAIDRMTALADEIAVGGQIYPQGVRDVARRMGQEAPVASRTLRAALARF